MEDPEGHVAQGGGHAGIRTAAHRHRRGEAVRKTGDEIPGAVPAHGEAGDVKPVGVDGILARERVKQIHHRAQFRADADVGQAVAPLAPVGIDPLPFRGALRHNDETGILALQEAVSPNHAEAVGLERGLVVQTAFTRAVQGENEGIGPAGIVLVRNEQPIRQGSGFVFVGAFEEFCSQCTITLGKQHRNTTEKPHRQSHPKTSELYHQSSFSESSGELASETSSLASKSILIGPYNALRRGPPWARPERFERSTYGLEVRCSIQLSYGRIYTVYNLAI